MTEEQWLLVSASRWFDSPPRGRNEWTMFLGFRERLHAWADAFQQASVHNETEGA